MKTTASAPSCRLIAARPIHSQEELAHLLEPQGYEATQATVSRDIKELGLVESSDSSNGDGVSNSNTSSPAGPSYTSRLHRVVAELVTDVSGSVQS